jgi:penicillin-binding protein 2
VPANLGLRLVVLRVLVLSLIVTLGARLYYLQLLDQRKLTQTATKQHTREVVLAAPRGPIVDDRGRPLVSNRVSLVVSVNRSVLAGLPGQGAAVLRRLAPLVGIPAAELAKRITPCQRGVPKPCWNGSPYQPVPVLKDTTPQVVLRIAEHREDFPGVTAETQTLRQYPGRSLAAHTLGYVGPVTQEELDTSAAAGTDLHSIDLVGRSGLEAEYDKYLGGTDGIRQVSIDNRGTVLGTLSETPPAPGDTLVTSIDRNVQAAAEKALADEIARRRTESDPKTGQRYKATSGAAVVLDPRTGRVIALASHPTYDPTVFVGGISQRELDALLDPHAGVPLVSRAVQGQFAPGSTFKLASASAEVSTGRASLSGAYPCPGSLKVGTQNKTNFDSEGIAGTITMAQALAKSCDTFFYAFAMQDWYADQARIAHHQKPVEALQRYARAFGFGSEPRIDLPAGEQTSGRIVDRAFLEQRWKANRTQYCADARRGYPDVRDPARRTFLTRLAAENCTDGWRFRLGDAADLSIGQGETTVSPLQLALAYASLVNGGTLWEPTIGRALLGPDGRVVREIKPKSRGRVPVSPQLLAYIRNSLAFTPQNGASGAVAFNGFPLDRVLVAGKTGTAEVFGKQDTSWFVSWAPAGSPKFVVAGMIEQAGLGARAAAPMVRQIYEAIFGLGGKRAALPGGVAPTAVPKITQYSTVRGNPAQPGGTASPSPGRTGAPGGAVPTASPAPHGTGGAVQVVTPAPSATVRALRRRGSGRRRRARVHGPPPDPPTRQRRAARPRPRPTAGEPDAVHDRLDPPAPGLASPAGAAAGEPDAVHDAADRETGRPPAHRGPPVTGLASPAGTAALGEVGP